jgi:formate-dependent nitrite reductase cytochrome c552 subunit
MGKTKRLGIVVFSGIAAAILLGAFLVSIARPTEAAKHTLAEVAVQAEADVRPEVWGRAFPAHSARYSAMKENSEATPFGGSLPCSKLLRYPQLTRLWAGYPFAADFNEERSHVSSQVDQMETKRNDSKWLQVLGFPDFKGQPGARMNCHRGWAPSLIRELGWETFNSTPYQDLKMRLEESHGEGIHAGGLGSTCADCHSPKDMSLRITRPAYLQAMMSRGYAADPEKCHNQSDEHLRERILSAQRKTSEQLRATEGNLLALISAIHAARLALENAGLASRADEILARTKASHRTARTGVCERIEESYLRQTRAS